MFNYKNTRTTKKEDTNSTNEIYKNTIEKCILKKCTVCSVLINKKIRTPVICSYNIPKHLFTNVCFKC